MKRRATTVIMVLILGALPLACGGSSGSGSSDGTEASGVEELCAKSSECMLLMGTEQDCVAQNNGNINALRALPECAPIVTANEDTFQCVSALDCGGVSDFLMLSDQSTHMCSQSGFSKVSDMDAQNCRTAIQNAAGGAHP